MKKLFRDRKLSIESKPRPVVSAPAPLGTTPPDTPLYARFASSHRPQDGPTKPTVSGPMHLLSRASFTRGHRGNEGQEKALNRMPSRGSEERVLSRMPSRQEQVQSKAKVLPTPPARSSSRAKWSAAATPEPPTPIAASMASFPRTDSYESRNTSQDKFSFPGAPTASSSHVQLPPPEPLSRPDSVGSDSYMTPPRPLVVRNGDPETSSSTSVSEIAAPKPASTPRPPAQIPASAQYNRFYQNGFDLHGSGMQEASSGSRQSPSASSPLETPLSTPLSSDRRDRQLATGRQTASRQESRSQYPSPPPKSSATGTLASVSSSTSTPAPAAPSLLTTPSITRRKYSPLAAFGLPATQASSSASPPLNTYTESARTNDDPSTQGVQHPGVPAFPSQAEPTGRDSLARPTVSASSPSLPPLPDNIQPAEQTNTPPPSPRPPVQRQSSYDDTEAEPRPSPTNSPNLTQRAPEVPVEDPPPYQPEPYSLRSGLQPLQQPQLPQPPVPDMVRRSPDQAERPPASPTKSRGARLHKQHRDQDEVSRSYESNRSTLQPSPPPQATGPIRGKPLIFAAMSSPSDIVDVEPAMVGMIGKASVETKIEQGYNAYAQGAHHHHHQQQQPTPPPDPTPSQAPDSSQKRKKLSKLHKPTSSRKAEPAPIEVPHSHVAGPSLSSLRTLEQSGASASHSHHRGTSVPVASVSDASERRPADVDRQSRRKSVAGSDGKLHRRPKDGVKPLTDKQMEKLNHRLSYNGVVPGHREQLSPPFRKSFVEEHPASHPIQTAQHRITPGTPSPTSSQGTRHMSPPPSQGSHHTQYMAPPPPAQGSHHTQYTPPSQLPPAQWANPPQKRHVPPQLPTPPEEYNPIIPNIPKARRDPSPQKVQPLPPMDVEELEVAVPLPSKKGHRASVLPPPPADADPVEPMSFPLVSFLSNPVLLENLLAHLSFFEWITLARVTKDVRRALYEEGREQVLERYLSIVGYSRWAWKDPEPLILTAEDLCHYMRGVSIPSHRWAAIATNYLQPNSITSPHTMKELTYACRAFTRVVVRLRAQAEAEAAHNARMLAMSYPDSASGVRPRTSSLTSQRLQSKWASQTSLNHGSRAPSRAPSPVSSRAPSMQQRAQHAERPVNGFQSPLFRLRRAPLLQVFVPSPDGDWLSDASVLECEAELKRAGVLHLLRAGDVVWDTAVGDEANTGRMVWDGSYLIDLDYTYSRVGDPPRYLPTLAFPPSYFHRVIRTMGTGNPIVRIDLAPWSAQIHENLQLLQDKIRMETPQGGKHTVVRWVHRSSFVIRPPPGSKSIRLPMPQTAGPGPSPTGAWIIDPGWFGTVVVETEGTNEGLDDLNRRCKGPIQLRRGQQLRPDDAAAEEQRTVFRILREKSRPSEIWIRVVTAKERLIPLQ